MKQTFLQKLLKFIGKRDAIVENVKAELLKEKPIETELVKHNISGGSFFYDTFDRKTNKIRAIRKVKNRIQGASRKANR